MVFTSRFARFARACGRFGEMVVGTYCRASASVS